MLRSHTTAVLLLGLVLVSACRDASVIPPTPLGKIATDWLTAHNRGEGHAAVHFTLTHQGSVRMTGLQVDSTVYAAVKFAQDVGRFVPVKLLESSDTSLVVLLRSARAGDFTVRFTPALQPSTSQVVVQVDH